MNSMTAVASFVGLPIEDPDSLQDVTTPIPTLRPYDVLVRVMAVSVNPADVKTRAGLSTSDEPIILGFDAAGIIEAVGPQVSSLAVGDEVWYAGDIGRQGSNAEFQAVDERIVARKPTSLSFAEAAAVPHSPRSLHGRRCSTASSSPSSRRRRCPTGRSARMGRVRPRIHPRQGLPGREPDRQATRQRGHRHAALRQPRPRPVRGRRGKRLVLQQG
jgi:hypothetical protein